MIGGILLIIIGFCLSFFVHTNSIKKNNPYRFIKWKSFWHKWLPILILIALIIGIYEGIDGILKPYGILYSILLNLWELSCVYVGFTIFDYWLRWKKEKSAMKEKKKVTSLKTLLVIFFFETINMFSLHINHVPNFFKTCIFSSP